VLFPILPRSCYTWLMEPRRVMDIVWLGDPLCGDPWLVGGKASSLSRLAASQRIPPGFCVTAAAHARRIANQTDTLPHELYQMVGAAYHSLASRCGAASPSVAVRSSAPDEDGRTASFAGQYRTFLNVAGVDSVAKAIAECWAAVGSERLQVYRDRQGGGTPDGIIAVLVQQLVAADQSAVAFSANPVTRRRDEVLINCNLGLGESIVSGTANPDTYAVRKSDWAITTRRVGDKSNMVVPGTTGTRAVPVPRSMRNRPAMSDTQVVRVAQLAESLEKATGWPVDIECCYTGGDLFLLQCRPITTISGA